MKKIYILFVILLVSNNILQAQNGLDPNFKQPKATLPEVASIMKYIDYPTDLNHGLINIDIPLYVLQEGDLTLPISLSYHASGLKIRSRSGKVGLGWTLNAEPSISRSIEGIEDEHTNGYMNTYINPNPPSHDPYQMGERILNGSAEITPDIFYYKLLDKSGRFYFNRDVYARNSPVEVVTQPYEPIKITYGSSIQSFNVVGDKGVNYSFVGAYGKANHKIVQWLATKISSPSGKYNINLAYKSATRKYQTLSSGNPYYIAIEENQYYDAYSHGPSPFQCGMVKFPIMTDIIDIRQDARLATYNIMQDEEYCTRKIDGICHYDGIKGENLRMSNYNCVFNYSSSGGGPMFSYQPIETISTSTTELRFIYDSILGYDDEQPLIKIEIKDKIKNEITQTIHFIQSSYKSGSEWKKLNEVRIADKNGRTVEKYSFDYEDQYLPRINGYASDYWGFIENSGFYTTGIPVQQVKINRYNDFGELEKLEMYIGDADKTLGSAAAGILKSITYPTGRKSTFFFENHQYMHDNEYQTIVEGRDLEHGKPVSEVRKAGGLRIAKIEEYDTVNESKLTKLYKYGKNEDGIGFVNHQPSMNDYTYEYNMITKLTGKLKTKVRMFVPESLASMLYSGGSSTKYDYVTEYLISDKNSFNNGKTVYKYRFDYPSMNSHVTGTTLNYNYDSEWGTGQLLEKTVYNSAMIPTPVHRTTYQYAYFRPKSISVSKVYKNIQFRFFDDYEEREYLRVTGENPYIYMGSYIQSGCIRIQSEAIESFDTNGNATVTESKRYTYGNNNHLYPTKIEINAREIGNKTEKMIYPQDIPSSLQNSAEKALVDKNQLNTLLKSETSFGEHVWTNINDYAVKGNNVVPISVWAGEKGKEEERVKILQHDAYGNPIHIQKDGGINSVYIWGYNGTCLIAEIQNATYEQVKAAFGGKDPASYSSLNSFPPEINNLHTNTTNLASALVSTYKYNPLVGITEATDPSGKTTYYEYDFLGRLKRTYFKEKNTLNQEEERNIKSYDYNYRNK